MTGTIIVPKLKASGKYVSATDWSDGFKDKSNPGGLFKMVVLPKETHDGYAIRYSRTKSGFLVEGEGYIISAGTEKELAKKADSHFRSFTGSHIKHIESSDVRL